jgi:hypothetical protein
VADSLVYHSLQCHCCRGNIEACTMDDVWAMRIDGVLHQVPVRKVPCHKCMRCDTVTLDGTSDEVVMYCLQKYMDAQGLNTPYLRVRRWIRRRVLGIRDRILRDWYRSMRTLRRETA